MINRPLHHLQYLRILVQIKVITIMSTVCIYDWYNLCLSDLDILKHKYTSLLQSFPLAHLATLECLQDHLTDDCICAVVEATSADSANKMMLDCMISRLTCKEDLLDLFDHLEEITDAHDVRSTVNALRQGRHSIK